MKLNTYKNRNEEYTYYDNGTSVHLLNQKSWFDNGQISHEYFYKDGKEEGPCKEWFDNGQLKNIQNFTEGKLDGVWESWNYNGQLSFKRNYKKGNRHGFQQSWSENGEIEDDQYYFNGEKCEDKYDDAKMNTRGLKI